MRASFFRQLNRSLIVFLLISDRLIVDSSDACTKLLYETHSRSPTPLLRLQGANACCTIFSEAIGKPSRLPMAASTLLVKNELESILGENWRSSH
ncbi:MAG: hypothetical protein PUP90_21340 [Nostoc sp. S4]|nr:hypothetical protein [Nostoc sp. S4]